jgi:ATP-binding cassette subfamily C protein
MKNKEPSDASQLRKPLGVIARLVRLLEPGERRLVAFSLFVRLSLVALDLVGLSLIGVTVSLISGTNIGSSSLTGKAISFLEGAGIVNVYAIFGLGSVIFFVAKGLLSLALNKGLLSAVARIEATKATRLFTRVSRGTLDRLQGLGKDNLGIALVDSLDMSVSKLIMSLSVIFGESTLMVAVAIYLAVLNPPLLLAMAAYFVILAFLMQILVAKRTRETAKKMQGASVAVNSSILDLFDNFRQLKSLGKSQLVVDKFAAARRTIAEGTATMSMLSVMPRYITEIALMLAFSLLLVQRSIAPNLFDAATLAIFVAGSFRIMASLLPFQGALALLKQISGSSELALHLMREYPTDQPGISSEAVSNISAITLEFKDVTFRFQGARRDALKSCSIKVSAGDYLAVTGRSGSGKSTFADLILGLRQPSEGEVLLNGTPASTFVGLHPGAIGYVPQQCALFEGSIEFNVALDEVRDDADRARVAYALDAAGMRSWVEELENGSLTIVGGSSRQLSGGQLQRLGIARVLYAQPRVLVLDESTSALDAQTEIEILDTLDRLGGNITIIAIAHRGAVIERAKRAIHFSNGEFVERKIG